MSVRITASRELATKLHDAQLEHTLQMLADYKTMGWSYSDDGYDYLRGALILSQAMMEICIDDDMKRLDEMLNVEWPEGELGSIGCDGVANAFYDLNCRALDDEENFNE